MTCSLIRAPPSATRPPGWHFREGQVGLLQTWEAVNEGTWYARSAEFMQTPTMDTLRWLRVPGDTIFAVGVLGMGWFMLGVLTGWSFKKEGGRPSDHLVQL